MKWCGGFLREAGADPGRRLSSLMTGRRGKSCIAGTACSFGAHVIDNSCNGSVPDVIANPVRNVAHAETFLPTTTSSSTFRSTGITSIRSTIRRCTLFFSCNVNLLTLGMKWARQRFRPQLAAQECRKRSPVGSAIHCCTRSCGVKLTTSTCSPNRVARATGA